MKIINDFKKKYLQDLASSSEKFLRAWQVLEPRIRSKLSSNPSGREVLDLGDKLSEIFRSNATSGRGQSELAVGGDVWERINSWYLNLICWDIPVMIVKKKKSFIPQIINDTLAVTISNSKTNSESDIVIFSVPNYADLKNSDLISLNNHLEERLERTDLINLQCKTNWNDNAQIPMLWDMIYNSDSRLPNISVGVNGVSPRSFNNFRYAFVTVPTNINDKFVSEVMAVLRVKNLTGGNYWGHPSKQHVASSIKELPNRNFSAFFIGGISTHIDNTIKKYPGYLEEFLTLSW